MNTELVYPRFRWFVFVTLCIVTASTAVALIAPAPLMGPIAKALDISIGEAAGATMGTFNLFVAISALVGGWFLDKFGAVRVWAACLILIIVGELLMPVFGGTFWGLNNLRIIEGLGTGPIMASTARIAAQWFPVKERGIVTGVQGMAMGLGITLGFIIAPAVFETTGNWAVTMAWLSFLPVIALIMTAVIAFGPKAPTAAIIEAQIDGSANEFMQAAKLPVTWMAILCVVMMSWAFQAINDLIPGYIAVDAPVGLGKGPMAAGKFMTAFSMSFTLGALLSGFILEKLLKGQSKPLVFLGYLGTVIFTFCLRVPFVISNEVLLLLCLILNGLFAAWCIPPSVAFIARNYPEHLTGKLGGLAQGIGIFGGTAGAFSGAYAIHATGFYDASIYIIVVIAILGCLSALGLNPPKNIAIINKGIPQ